MNEFRNIVLTGKIPKNYILDDSIFIKFKNTQIKQHISIYTFVINLNFKKGNINGMRRTKCRILVTSGGRGRDRGGTQK